MKSKEKRYLIIVGVLAVALILGVMRFVPIYSTTATGCASKNKTVHKSLIAGSSKSTIQKDIEVKRSIDSKYDCPLVTITYKLYIL